MKFTDLSTSGGEVKSMTWRQGINKFRPFGNVLCRKRYWIKDPSTDKDIPIEDLSFNRDTCSHDYKEKDWVPEFVKGEKSKIDYAVLAFTDDGIEIVNLKQSIINSLVSYSKKYWGDVTDPEKGRLIVVERTGSGRFDTRYTIDPLACVEKPLTDEEKEQIKAHPTIEELLKRPTPDEIRSKLEEMFGAKAEAADALDDDVPF